LQSSTISMSLRERIPTLDQTVSLVRDVALAVNAAPLSITAVSEPRRHVRRHSPGNSNKADQFSDSGIGNSPARPRSQEPVEESFEGLHTRNTLNLDSLRSALPEELSGDVPPSRSERTPRHPFLRRPRTSTSGNQSGLSNENSTQAIHWKYIGILGEVFVSITIITLPIKNLY
jgi:hypothetical protein